MLANRLMGLDDPHKAIDYARHTQMHHEYAAQIARGLSRCGSGQFHCTPKPDDRELIISSMALLVRTTLPARTTDGIDLDNHVQARQLFLIHFGWLFRIRIYVFHS
jgi:hypothetical protein